jgi:hypothetical protein
MRQKDMTPPKLFSAKTENKIQNEIDTKSFFGFFNLFHSDVIGSFFKQGSKQYKTSFLLIWHDQIS